MHFLPSRYMEFAKSLDLTGIQCNLAFSGIHSPFSLAELGVTPQVLDNVLFEPYGNSELKAAIAARYGVEPDQVLTPGGGTSLANFLIGAALLGSGDQALIETPTYECLEATIASTGARIIPLPRRAERGYDLDLAEIDRLFHPPVKLLVVTRLHNPTGRDIPEETLLHLGQVAEAINAYVLVDEVYLDFLPPECIKIAAALHPRLITTASLTKVYDLGDLRVGWAIGPKDLIGSCWRINNVLGVNPPTVPDQIALTLFRNGGLDRIASWARQRAAQNLSVLERFLSNRTELSWVKPEGGIVAFLRLSDGRPADRLLRADAFTALLREKYRTLVMPGSYFGQADGFRLGFGGPKEELQEGLSRLGEALKEFSQKKDSG